METQIIIYLFWAFGLIAVISFFVGVAGIVRYARPAFQSYRRDMHALLARAGIIH